MGQFFENFEIYGKCCVIITVVFCVLGIAIWYVYKYYKEKK
jgi:hypothetical protein